MTWKRLEGSGVSADLTPGLEARIADPLWLLARQWQTGEFAGEDAASPVFVDASVNWQPVGEMRIGSARPQPLDPATGLPLEVRVEAESVRNGAARVRLSAEVAMQLLRMARAAGADGELLGRLQQENRLTLPPDDGLDPGGRLELRLLAQRAFDGLALADKLSRGLPPDPAIKAVATSWLDAIAGAIVEPASSVTGWDSSRMEYRFQVAAPAFVGGTQLDARDFAGGHLDWHAFDVAAKQPPSLADNAQTVQIATIPTPLDLPGMPADRWWEFEDGAVYWGGIEGAPEDLARYLVAAFTTVYGNDWFLVPVDLPRGSLAQAATVHVVDSFGRRRSIASTATLDYGVHKTARRFRMFELTNDSAVAAGFAPRLLLAASLPPHEEGKPLEEVFLLRDEVGNLAWAAERVVESAAGHAVSRASEAQRESTPDDGGAGTWTYDVSSRVPPYFVPLVPVKVRESEGIRLQRGRVAGGTGSSGARGRLLEPSRRLLMHEEEVPSSGVRLTRAFEMCRGSKGQVYLWCGRRKSPGARLNAPGLVHDIVHIRGASD